MIARKSSTLIKLIQEGLGGIREVLLSNTQAVYTRLYRKEVITLRRVQAATAFIIQSPRFTVEAIGMILIVIIAYWIVTETDNQATAIPVIGALALELKGFSRICNRFIAHILKSKEMRRLLRMYWNYLIKIYQNQN